ncbi:MAG TPA: hypothetical protein VFI25_11095 [Planctomycetota bacterium]|nr:hypothetical protein [Planctomycetota bacterium]
MTGSPRILARGTSFSSRISQLPSGGPAIVDRAWLDAAGTSSSAPVRMRRAEMNHQAKVNAP